MELWVPLIVLAAMVAFIVASSIRIVPQAAAGAVGSAAGAGTAAGPGHGTRGRVGPPMP